ncbi:Mrr restriction system protein [Paraburkholderia sp. Ac-20340]|uniref:restriction endonuclease n=1 Tax=Paraburkholderia sp. Ac-20340 TaxID=2703888 RepID=UPI00198093AA|nr:Mrr restriction system protein [Paraburkholderia sp. Ac-20340]MBN3855677.1 Mrr restriction system protein [Paraburkholderia sp. Ac-20340]
MADITRRRTGELLRGLFAILLNHPEGLPAREALVRLEKNVTLSDYEKGEYDSGGRRFDKIVRFATVDCVKAGWLLKNKGVWVITEEGRTAYEKLQDPEAFYRLAVKLYQEWRATQPDAAPSTPDEPEDNSSGKAASITLEEAEEQAWDEIAQYLHHMNPYDFQALVGDLLRAMGYYVDWEAPPGRDGGLDILAWPDPLGTKPPRIKVQVKRQTSAVTVEGVRSFLAVLGDEDVGLFVALGGFTRDAVETARNQERRRLTLIDIRKLHELWVTYYKNLSDEARRRMPLRPVYFLSPEG